MLFQKQGHAALLLSRTIRLLFGAGIASESRSSRAKDSLGSTGRARVRQEMIDSGAEALRSLPPGTRNRRAKSAEAVLIACGVIERNA